jgi:Tol biopolymer transport system component
VYHARAGDAYVLVLRQGGKVGQLVDGAEPAWSPDGDFVAFHRGDRVMVIDVIDGHGGEAKTMLTTGSGDNPDPAW